MDALKGKIDHVVVHVASDYSTLKKTLKIANKNLIPLAMNHFLATLFLHALLPLGYLFFMYKVICRLILI